MKIETKIAKFNEPLYLESGRILEKFELIYETYGELNEDKSNVKGEIVVFHGTADKSVSMDDFADLAKKLEAQKVTHEMLTYSGAPHAFTKFGSDRYHERADKASWARFSEILDETLKN